MDTDPQHCLKTPSSHEIQQLPNSTKSTDSERVCGSISPWILIILGSRRIKGESRIQICIKLKIQELCRLKMEQWRAVDAHNGGMKAQWRGYGGVCTSVVADYFDEEQDPDSGSASK